MHGVFLVDNNTPYEEVVGIDDDIADDEASEAPKEIKPLAEDLLDAISELNAERDRAFGLVAGATSTKSVVDVNSLVLHAKEHGIGSLILLFKDAINQIGYSPISSVEFIHKKSGVVVKL